MLMENVEKQANFLKIVCNDKKEKGPLGNQNKDKLVQKQ